jgi:hypothetical protein
MELCQFKPFEQSGAVAKTAKFVDKRSNLYIFKNDESPIKGLINGQREAW